MITHVNASIDYLILALCENSEIFCRTGLGAVFLKLGSGRKMRDGKSLRHRMRAARKYFSAIKNRYRITRVIKNGQEAFALKA
jgi:hypothetical protein